MSRPARLIQGFAIVLLAIGVYTGTETAAQTGPFAAQIQAALRAVGLSGAPGTFTVPVRLPDGTAALPSLAFTSSVDLGVYKSGAAGTSIGFSVNGVSAVAISALETRHAVDHKLTWSPSTPDAQVGDVSFGRDAANTLAQRNGTNAQAFRVYNTFTDASNYERGEASWTSNTFTVATARAGTGSARTMEVGTIGNSNFQILTNNVVRWRVDNNGHLVAPTDNTYDIGASGATRLRSMYWGTQLLGPDGTTTNPSYSFANDTNSGIRSSSNDIVAFVANGGDRFLVATNTFRGANFDVQTLGQVDVPFLDVFTNRVRLVATGGNSNPYTQSLIKKITGMGDAASVDLVTVTVPNANQAASVRVWLTCSTGSTDAFESTRVAEGMVVLARTTGVTTVAAVTTLEQAQIATVAAGATLTLTYGVTAMTGAAGAQQTFTIQGNVNDSGNLGSNQCVVVADVANSQAGGVTIS